MKVNYVKKLYNMINNLILRCLVVWKLLIKRRLKLILV